jgi:hypothetical protein
MSNNLLAFKYKTLTAGTNITLYDNAGQIVINATGGGGTGGNVTDVSTGVTASNIFRYSFLPSVGTITPVPANDKLTFQIDQAILPFTPTQAFISINFRTYITNPWPAVLVFNSIGNDYAHAIEFFLFNPTANTCYIDGATVISLLFMG